MRGSGIGYLQGIPAGLDTIKNQKNNRGNTTWANVTRRVYAVGRPKLTTNDNDNPEGLLDTIDMNHMRVFNIEAAGRETKRGRTDGESPVGVEGVEERTVKVAYRSIRLLQENIRAQRTVEVSQGRHYASKLIQIISEW